jgi:hypothetical protein
VTIALSWAQGISNPSRKDVYAALLVVAGALICTLSDVWMTAIGIFIGCFAVLANGQYQIYQGSIQKAHRLSSTQALHIMSLPQAVMTFAASVLVETNWARVLASSSDLMDRYLFRLADSPVALAVDVVSGGKHSHAHGASHGTAASAASPAVWMADIWTHGYSTREVLVILLTCAIAMALNYSTLGIIGKTSAISMQFIAQLKTVLVVAIGLLLFPTNMSFFHFMYLLSGLALVFTGVAWYTKLRNTPAAPQAVPVSAVATAAAPSLGAAASPASSESNARSP